MQMIVTERVRKMIKCDTSMRRSKEDAVRQNPNVHQWRCLKDCERCICGMKPNYNTGAWEHINTDNLDRRKK